VTLRIHQAVLVVDDDAPIRLALLDVLQQWEQRAVGARDGLEALRILDLVPLPCLVLLDWRMPRLDGAGFLTQLEARPDAADFSVLVMSAHLRKDVPFLHPSVVGVLPKPFNVWDLLTVVERYCGRPGSSPGVSGAGP
jgi:CheY-like chemotaxis protein